MNCRNIAVGGCLSVLGCAVAHGQMSSWHSMSNTTGTNGVVEAGIVWDPDGPGPQRPLAVVGGMFSAAVDVLARNVAAWDGTRWHPLGEGLAEMVRCFTVWNGDLIAGGYFREVGGLPATGLARWNGQTWEPIVGLAEGSDVYAMTTFGDELVVAGLFQMAGGTVVNNIAALGPSGWRAFDQGLSSVPVRAITAVGVYDGTLYAGGDNLRAGATGLGSLARWNGQHWESTPVIDGSLYAVTVIDDSLYVPGGRLGTPSPSYISLRFDGQAWSGLGPVGQINPGPPMKSVASFRDEVYVAGTFSEPESYLTNIGVAVVGEAMSYLPGGSVNFPANVVMAYEDELIAGGQFLRAGDHSAQYVARWNGEHWLPTGVGTNSHVYALAEYRGELIAGGLFRGIAGYPVDGVARWNGASWRPLGDGLRSLSNAKSVPEVKSVSLWRDQLLVAGAFRIPNREDAMNLAAWDGQTWIAIEPRFEGIIDSMATLGDQILVSGQGTGPFNGTGHGPHLWNGQEWITTIENNSRIVDAMFEYQGAVLAGLSVRDGIMGVGRWDGAAWHQMGSALHYNNTTSQIKTFAEHHGELYVGGFFNRKGETPVPPFVRWNGQDWEPIALPPEARSVNHIASHHGRLYAAIGYELTAPTGTGTAVYAWDGQTWERLGSVTWGQGSARVGSVHAILSHDESLHIAGNFTVVDDRVVSARIARYGPASCYPDCDRSTGTGILDIFDFLCFGNRFAANDPYACDCDTSTGLGVCDIFDFLCFGNAFSAGCR